MSSLLSHPIPNDSHQSFGEESKKSIFITTSHPQSISHVLNSINCSCGVLYTLFPRVTNPFTTLGACHNLHEYIYRHRKLICFEYVNQVRQTFPILCARRLTSNCKVHDTSACVIPSFIRLYKSSLFHAYIRND